MTSHGRTRRQEIRLAMAGVWLIARQALGLPMDACRCLSTSSYRRGSVKRLGLAT